VDGAGFEPRTFSFEKREPSLRENSLLFSLSLKLSHLLLALTLCWWLDFYVGLANVEVNFSEGNGHFSRFRVRCSGNFTKNMRFLHSAFHMNA